MRGPALLERGHAVVDEASEVVALDPEPLHLADHVPLERVVRAQPLPGLVHAAVELEGGARRLRHEQERDRPLLDVRGPHGRIVAEHRERVVVVGILVQAEVGALARLAVDLEALVELRDRLDGPDRQRLLAARLAHVLAVLLRHVGEQFVLGAPQVEDQSSRGQHRGLRLAPAAREREDFRVLVGLDRHRDGPPGAVHVRGDGVGHLGGRGLRGREIGIPRRRLAPGVREDGAAGGVDEAAERPRQGAGQQLAGAHHVGGGAGSRAHEHALGAPAVRRFEFAPAPQLQRMPAEALDGRVPELPVGAGGHGEGGHERFLPSLRETKPVSSASSGERSRRSATT